MKEYICSGSPYCGITSCGGFSKHLHLESDASLEKTICSLSKQVVSCRPIKTPMNLLTKLANSPALIVLILILCAIEFLSTVGTFILVLLK